MEKLVSVVGPYKFDSVITVGDTIHGVEERGGHGLAGRAVMAELLSYLPRLAKRVLFQVPSEHELGYWDGVDYFPHVKWWPFRFIVWLIRLLIGHPHPFPRLTWNSLVPRPGLILQREIGGRYDPDAITQWLERVGPLWGSTVVEGWTFVWLDCDLIRWREKFYRLNNSYYLDLMRRQDEFLQQVLMDAPIGRVVLFTHRVSVMIDPVLRRFWYTIHAVTFGDAHFAAQARRDVAALGLIPFKTWFIPAAWGFQCGIGHPGYATINVTPEAVTFTSTTI
ncbi:MAG: hypothetical protein WC734_02745 [Patescibacteria group bacterium]